MTARRLRSAAPRIAAATLKPTQLLALQAFDVAVRLGSFKDTADALNLSASAVSHRIRNLEQALGAALFVRNHRAIEPTAEGRALAAATGRAFAELARVDLPSGGTAGRQRLKLKVFPLFASAWLIPRLAGFVAKHPDIDLAIETSSYTIDFDVEAFDAGISVGDGSFAGLDALHLAPLRATPIATPALARRLKLREPRDLARAVLIHVTPFPGCVAAMAGACRCCRAKTCPLDRGRQLCRGHSSRRARRRRCAGHEPVPRRARTAGRDLSSVFVPVLGRELFSGAPATRTAQPRTRRVQALARVGDCRSAGCALMRSLPI